MTSSRVGAPLIEARNITKHYDGFTLQGVSLTVEPGQIVGFIGQNGAGKSTTIKALLGIIGIDAGDARILGVDARGLSGADAAVKERIGIGTRACSKSIFTGSISIRRRRSKSCLAAWV